MNNIKLKYFSDANDFKGNMDKMDPKLLGMLDALRKTYGFPIIINSSYRSPEHPIEAAKEKPGEHAHGAAVDIKCAGGEATYLLVAAKDNLENMVIELQKQMLENQDNVMDKIILKAALDFDDRDSAEKILKDE